MTSDKQVERERPAKEDWRHAWRDKTRATGAEVKAFVDAVAAGTESPVSFASAVNATRATFAILSSLRTGASVDVDSATSPVTDGRH